MTELIWDGKYDKDVIRVAQLRVALPFQTVEMVNETVKDRQRAFDLFHNEWQKYRTRKSPDLQKSTIHSYEASGEYTVVVGVIDILGSDTTKTLRVKVVA